MHRYLTGALGYEKIRALYMMEQCRLVERLPIKVQKFVDGKPDLFRGTTLSMRPARSSTSPDRPQWRKTGSCI